MVLTTVYTVLVKLWHTCRIPNLGWIPCSPNSYVGLEQVATAPEHAKMLGLTVLKEYWKTTKIAPNATQ